MSQNATDALDEAAAAYLGINRTDARALDVIERLGRVSAGELAREMHLTTGAVTTVVTAPVDMRSSRASSPAVMRWCRSITSRARASVRLMPR